MNEDYYWPPAILALMETGGTIMTCRHCGRHDLRVWLGKSLGIEIVECGVCRALWHVGDGKLCVAAVELGTKEQADAIVEGTGKTKQ